MTLRKMEDNGNLKRKQYIALYGEIALEETMDLP
jgi:ribosomal protein L19E